MSGPKRLFFPFILLCLIYGTRSELTAAELMNMMQGFRASCQPKFDVSVDLLDGISLGRFPENNQLKCYVKCILEALNMMKKGKVNHELAIKQINLFMPVGIREEYLKGINTCKDYGNDITDHCDKAYAILKCFFGANTHFMFP